MHIKTKENILIFIIYDEMKIWFHIIFQISNQFYVTVKFQKNISFAKWCHNKIYIIKEELIICHTLCDFACIYAIYMHLCCASVTYIFLSHLRIHTHTIWLSFKEDTGIIHNSHTQFEWPDLNLISIKFKML